MSRPLRIQYPGAVYHVLNRGLARQRVFRAARDCERFLEGLAGCGAGSLRLLPPRDPLPPLPSDSCAPCG
jgi:hypothetical protein